MVQLCQYRDALGQPGKGIHSYRIGGIAVADVLMTIATAYLIQQTVSPRTPFWLVLGALFLLGIALHRLFCVRTTVDRWLWPKDPSA
jgi:hypothetical protein